MELRIFRRASPRIRAAGGIVSVVPPSEAARRSSRNRNVLAAALVWMSLAALCLPSSSSGADRSLRAMDMSVGRLQTNCLSIVLEAQGNENALGFSVCFDTNLLMVTSVRRGSGAGGGSLNVNTNQLTRGRLGIALSLSSGETFPAGSASLVDICFRAAPITGIVATIVALCDTPIVREAVDVNASTIAASYSNALVTVIGTCTYSLTAGGASFAATGGMDTVQVTVEGGCTWSVVNTNSWITISSSTNSTGDGSVNYSVAPNLAFTARTGVVMIAGQSFTVSQMETPCVYALSASSHIHSRELEAGSVGVTAGSGCRWTVVNSNSWVAITSATNGIGNGSVTYAVTANGSSIWRTGVVTIAGQAFTVIQAAVPCTFSIQPTSRIHTAASEAAYVNVMAPDGCDWVILNPNDWMIIKLYTNGTGNGIARYTVFANPNPVGRSGVITIAGLPFTVYQLGAPCTYSLLRTNELYGFAGGSGTITLSTVSECSWTVDNTNSWIKLPSGTNGTGGTAINFEVDPNWQPNDRTGVVYVASHPFVVTQLGTPCQYSLSQSSKSFSYSAATGSVNVTTASSVISNVCPWVVNGANDWITLLLGSNCVNDCTVGYAVAANPIGLGRTGVLNIAGQRFTITQSGVPCTYALSPTSRSHGFLAESGQVNVSAIIGCGWTASTTYSWITITSLPRGSGSGTVSYRLDANTGPSRTGKMTIAGATFTINQAAATPVSLTSGPVSQGVVAGGTVVLNVSATGTGPLNYQWRFNGTNLTDGPNVSGAATASLTLFNVRAAQAGNYSVVVSNIRGPVTSASALLSVNTAPILGPIGTRAVFQGSLVTFRATATDPDLPAQTLSYSLAAAAPSGASINSTSGVFTWTPPSTQAPGTNSVTVRVTDNGSPSLSDSKTVNIIVFAGASTNLSFIATGSVWKYRDTGQNLGTAWRALAYTDTNWASGPAKLGYGWGDEATVVGYGPDSGAKYVTTYFRRRFNVVNPGAFSALNLRIMRDDGAAVYLNGSEVLRDNLPAGPFDYLTLAPLNIGGSDEGIFVTMPPVDSRFLVQGDNIVAVEIHQHATSSGDMNFDLELTAFTTPVLNNPPVLARLQNQTVNCGCLLSFKVSATDADLPGQTLTCSLDPGAPDGTSMDTATGLFTWTPTAAQAPGTNSVTFRVTDDGSPPLTDSQTITIVVLDSQFVIGNISIDSAQIVRLSWNAIPGKSYRVQYTGDLPAGSWFDLFPDVLATDFTASASDPVGVASQRFYRIVLRD